MGSRIRIRRVVAEWVRPWARIEGAPERRRSTSTRAPVRGRVCMGHGLGQLKVTGEVADEVAAVVPGIRVATVGGAEAGARILVRGGRV